MGGTFVPACPDWLTGKIEVLQRFDNFLTEVPLKLQSFYFGSLGNEEVSFWI